MRYTAILFCLFLLMHSTASAQTDTIPYGTVKNMPTFYEQLKRQLTYPMAWGNSPTKDFDRWRAEARNILTECMQNLTPAPQSYDMETVDTESRNGYKAHKSASTSLHGAVSPPICWFPMARVLSPPSSCCTTTVPISPSARRR